MPQFALSHAAVGVRAFSTAGLAPGATSSTMTREQAELLHNFQSRFESNPSSVDNAYKLFRELNKHHMYLSVIRLYWKYEMVETSKKGTSAASYSMMQSQYEFAKDHIQ